MMLRGILPLLLAGALAGCASGPPPVQPTSGDMERLHAAESEALENAQTGTGVNWENPKTGHRGSVTVLGTYDRDERPCRKTQRIFNADSTTRTGRAWACRSEAGEWEIVRSTPLRTAREQAFMRSSRAHFHYGMSGFGYHRHYGIHGYGYPYWMHDDHDF